MVAVFLTFTGPHATIPDVKAENVAALLPGIPGEFNMSPCDLRLLKSQDDSRFPEATGFGGRTVPVVAGFSVRENPLLGGRKNPIVGGNCLGLFSAAEASGVGMTALFLQSRGAMAGVFAWMDGAPGGPTVCVSASTQMKP